MLFPAGQDWNRSKDEARGSSTRQQLEFRSACRRVAEMTFLHLEADKKQDGARFRLDKMPAARRKGVPGRCLHGSRREAIRSCGHASPSLPLLGRNCASGQIENAFPYMWVLHALELQWHGPRSNHLACGPDGRRGYSGQRSDRSALPAQVVPAAAGLRHHAQPQRNLSRTPAAARPARPAAPAGDLPADGAGTAAAADVAADRELARAREVADLGAPRSAVEFSAPAPVASPPPRPPPRCRTSACPCPCRS